MSNETQRPMSAASFRGKPLTDMTRDELIEAVKYLGRLYQDQLHEHMRQLDVIAGK